MTEFTLSLESAHFTLEFSWKWRETVWEKCIKGGVNTKYYVFNRIYVSRQIQYPVDRYLKLGDEEREAWNHEHDTFEFEIFMYFD